MPALEVRALSKRYGRAQAVENVTLTVERGQIYGLLGPNGSGKTTTLGCALGLIRPSRGDVRILGEPARRIHRTQGRVGAVFDIACLLKRLTVRQNLEYARRLLGRPGGRGPAEVMELVGIDALAKRRAGRLSLGEQKRVAIARALLGSPELLVLDEPLSALDTLGARATLSMIRRLSEEGLTFILSSHRLPEMETVITHAGILAKGRVLAEGALPELLGERQHRYRLRISPVDRAERVLADLGGIECLEQHARRGDGAGDGTELIVCLDGCPIDAVNRALVRAGCSVFAIVPERHDLVSAFEGLVDAARSGDDSRAEGAS